MNSRFAYWLLLLGLWLPSIGRAQAALSDKYRQKAESLYDAGDYEKAIIWYERAYELVRHTDPVRAANLCVDLSSIDYMKNHTRKAANRCLLGLRYINHLKITPDSVRFKLFSSLGTYYIALYRNDSASFYFRKADALLAHNLNIEHQIPLYVLYHFNNQGSWFFKTGNYTRTIIYLTKAREIALRYQLWEDIAYIESNLAGCYDKMNGFEESLKHRQIANKFYKKLDAQKCRNLSGLGWTLYELKRYSEALNYFSKAERLMETLRKENKSINYLSDQIHLWRMIGSCYRAASQLSVANRYVDQALNLYHQHMGIKGALLAQVLIEKGKLYEAKHEPERAVKSYQAAIRAVCRDTTELTNDWQNPPVETASDEAILLLAAARKAAVLKEQYDATGKSAYLTASVTAYRFCVELQQRIRHGIDTDQSQLIFSDHQHTLIPDAIMAAFEAYQHQESIVLREALFEFFEQAQAGSLREAFRLNSIKPQTIPPPLLEREQYLKKRISELKKLPISDKAASKELIDRQLQWHRLAETFRQDYPEYYRLNYQDVSMSSRTLQQRLGNQGAYLAYVRQGSSLFILVATDKRFDVIRQSIDSVRFDYLLAQLSHELYRDPVLGQYNGTSYAAELYAACIEPIRKQLVGKTRLVISRDWSFNFLPFEVLEAGRQSRDYLTRHVAIAYAFSAQSFFDIHQRPVSTNPVLVVAPFARAEALESTVNRAGEDQTLASSEAEARSIGGDVLIGSEASLSNFLKTSLNRPVVYFATHARTDEADPTNSYIAFYPGESDKLYTEAIYYLPLTSTGLAVLGACETGSGQTMKGEGILSLARAFAYAGCPSVITTLWKANDETTSFLTTRLHHYLSDGMDIDQALRQARLDLFDSPIFPKYDHPYYWANYILLGNYQPVMPAGNRSVWFMWLFIALAIGLLFFWQRKHLIHVVRSSG